ncbi:MAG: hypothetical protein C4536_10475 [Actinobacteria bacterium]|jgi:hypothetical protein|nr:MAG: hypothetical protein C4536_10475 [Actinomycetota bacterium]
MEPDYRRAIRLALGEKRLWAAGLLAAIGFSEAWWIVFGWGPESLGERWERAVGGWMGDAAAFVAFVLAALAAFVVLKAVGYLGEMVLVRQVAHESPRGVPGFAEAFSSSRRRYIPFAVTLLPWDALRIAVIYLPTLIILAWDRWDPRLHHVLPYILVMLVWFLILLAVYYLAGITVTLAARSSLLQGEGIPEAWRRGWELLRGNAGRCLAVWLQAVAADILFVVIAWPLSALLPWVAGQVADPIGFAPARWLIHLLVYAVLAGGLVIMQAGIQCYRSSLWTITFLALSGEPEDREDSPQRGDTGVEGETFYPPLTQLPGPPPGFMP